MPSGVKMTLEYFVTKATEVHNNKYSYELIKEFKGCRNKLPVICRTHGVFNATPYSHLQGQGCPRCADEENRKRLLYDNKKFIEKAIKKHGTKYDYSVVDMDNRDEQGKVCIICHEKDDFGNEHGIFHMVPKFHLRGQGCPRCAGIYNYTNKEWIELAKKRHSCENYDYSKTEYINNRMKVCIVCPTHGKFWRNPKHFLYSKIGCPYCAHRSLMEDEISKFLNEHNIKYIHETTRKTFNWLENFRLDFYLPDYNVAIECQGEQHFKPIDFAGKGEEWANMLYKMTIERDNRKREICKLNNVKLLYYAKSNKNCPYEVITNTQQLLKEIKNNKTN